VGIDAFANDALSLYQSRSSIEGAVGSLEFNRRLVQQGVLLESPSGEFAPTPFGLLLFGANPRDSFPQAGLLATMRYSNGKEEARDFTGPLVLVPESVEQWLEERLPNLVSRESMRRESTPDIPLVMVREAVVNALVHRDYDVQGAKCQLLIRPDTIVVKSPGRPVPPVTLDQMQAFSAPMLSRNPQLHYAFAQMELAEERGLGLASLRERSVEMGLPLPRYGGEDPYVVLTLFRSAEAALDALPKAVVESMSATERSGWVWFAGKGVAGSAEYAEAMDVDTRSARRHLSLFVDLGLAKVEGAGRSTLYRVL
jgi:ATP-dependent DNA helicase RecG